MNKIIGPRPTMPPLEYLKNHRDECSWFPFNQSRCYYYYSARYALAAGIKALKLTVGDSVILPSFNCGVEIEPFLHAGVTTDFYQIDCMLNTDINDLNKRITGNVKAVLVTHFIGFPQPIEEIRKLCYDKGVYLIEDCAHALLSSDDGVALGSFGDIAVFSPLKTLPVLNGGILLINNDAIHWEHYPARPSRFSATYYYSDVMSQKTSAESPYIDVVEKVFYKLFSIMMNGAKYMIAITRKLFNLGGNCLVRPDSFDYRPTLVKWGISDASMRIIKGAQLDRIKEVRRANFCRYLNHFLNECPYGMTIPFKQIPDGVCPLFFPVIIEGDGDREKLYQALKHLGITTHPWWNTFHKAVKWDKYPDAVYLKKRMLGLPVHQDVDKQHIDYIITSLRSVMYRK